MTRLFTVDRQMLDVTSAHRPDTTWWHTDVNGHQHTWYVDGCIAKDYNLASKYTLPTLRSVVDETVYDEDGEPRDISHLECIKCGECVNPMYTSDQYEQFITGAACYRIDGVLVSKDVWDVECLKDMLDKP